VVTAWQLTACVIAQPMYIAIKLPLHIKIQFIPHKKLSCASIIKNNQCMLVLTEARNIFCEVHTKSMYKKGKGNNVINNENTATQTQHCFPLHYCPTSFCQQCFYCNFTSTATKKKTCLGLHGNSPIFFPYFNQIWICSTDFNKSFQHQISLTSIQWGADIRTQGQTRDEANCCFMTICKRTLN